MEEKILYLTASGQSLQNNTKQVFASNTVKYVGAIFSLDENWQSMDTVRAIWHTDGEPISTVLDHDGYASIPPEMLVKVAPVMVNLVGSVTENNELKERLTTFPILALRVTADALINGGETAPITPSQFEQYVAVVKNDADRAEQAVEDVEQIKTDVIQLKEDTETLKEQTAQLKADTAEIKTEVETLAEGFDETVAQAKSEIETLSTTEQGAISTLSANKKAEITQEGTTQKNSVTAEGTAQKGAITSLATDKLNAITQEGNTQTQRVTAEGNTQTSRVTQEGTTQVGLVTAEGEAQITEIQHIGAETIASIPKLAPVITDTVSGDIVSFTDGADNYPIKSLKVSLEPKQSGTGDPSPDNVRPISGWSGVTVEQSKLNLLNPTYRYNQPSATNCHLRYYWGGTGTEYYTKLLVKKGVTYTLSYDGTVADGIYVKKGTSAQDQANVFIAYSKNFITFTPTEDFYFALDIFFINAPSGGIEILNPTLTVGSTATAYEPYQGESYSIPFKDSQGNPITVYGGNMNITDGDGESLLGVTHIKDLNWVKQAGFECPNGTYFTATVDVPFMAWSNGGRESALCNALKKGSASVGASNADANTFWWNDGRTGYRAVWGQPNNASSLEDFIQFITDNDVVYVGPLATPTPIYCEPTEIKTLKGNNNIWCDTGDISVEYPADTKLYIDKKINALI